MKKFDSVISEKSLRAFAETVFERLGMPSQEARISADALLWANLRGVDAQGVIRIPWYHQLVESGGINPKPSVTTVMEAQSSILVEADHSAGPPVTVRVMEKGILKAKETGICACLIRNHSHLGAMGYYTEMAARADMVGILTVSALPNMAPYGACSAGLHNSPLSIAAPAEDRRPVVLDMATSVVAMGKIYQARNAGIEIPDGWGLDADGKPTTDPGSVKCLLPVAGAKGSGLSMMLSLLTSTMAGNSILGPILRAKNGSLKHRQNSLLIVIDVSKFCDIDQYKSQVDLLIDGLKGLPRMPDFDEITFPGERRRRIYKERHVSGIPLDAQTVSGLRSTGVALDIEVPF